MWSLLWSKVLHLSIQSTAAFLGDAVVRADLQLFMACFDHLQGSCPTLLPHHVYFTAFCEACSARHSLLKLVSVYSIKLRSGLLPVRSNIHAPSKGRFTFGCFITTQRIVLK